MEANKINALNHLYINYAFYMPSKCFIIFFYKMTAKSYVVPIC